MTPVLAPVRRVDILLMTATITPTNAPSLVRTDPALRLEDYRQALDFYIGQLKTADGRGANDRKADGRGAIDRIIFCENSDSDVSTLRTLAQARGVAEQVEFIANYGDQSCPGQDRTLGENLLTDHAVDVSRFIAEAGDAAVVWKITGRYQVVNLRQMIRTAPKSFDIYCDMRKRPMHWMDLRFIAWTPRGYNRVLRDMGTRFGAEPKEPLMYDYMAALNDTTVVKRYRREPLVHGVRGWNGVYYARGVGLLKYAIRTASRRLLPNLWI